MGTEVFDIAAMVPEVHAVLAGSLSSVPVPVVFPTRHDCGSVRSVRASMGRGACADGRPGRRGGALERRSPCKEGRAREREASFDASSRSAGAAMQQAEHAEMDGWAFAVRGAG